MTVPRRFPPADAASLLERFDAGPGTPGVPHSLLATIAHAGTIAGSWLDFSISLLTAGVLPARVRELAILRIAWRTRSEYVWGGHAQIAAAAGLEAPEVAAAADGGAATVEDALVLRACDELLDSGTIAAPTWESLAAIHSPAELVELVLTVGNYRTVAWLDAVFELQPEPGLPHLPPSSA